MEINNISFKSNLIEQIHQKQQIVTPKEVSTPKDTVELSNKKTSSKKKKTMWEAITGGFMLLVAFFKRKSIAKVAKNLFNIGKKQTKSVAEKTANKGEKVAESAAENITNKIPKPQFTCGPEKPEQYAKEKAEYINSIWDEYIQVQTVFKPINKEKNLQGLKMLNEYGTVEDLRRLPDEYSIVKDDDLYREYAKFVTKVGTDFEDFLFLESGLSKRCDIGSEKTVEEIVKGIKKIRVDIIKENAFEGASWSQYKDLKKCLDKYPDNKVITENLNAVIKKMTDENPWMIEEINKLKK